MTVPAISVVIPTRNPDRDRLHEVLAALTAQRLPAENWEVCVVDNGSSPAISAADIGAVENFSVVREETPGLLAARLCGLHGSRGRYVVFIDDDTVPDRDFLVAAVAFMDAHPAVGTAGGRIVPRYLGETPPWIDTVSWLLALRDNGPAPLEWSVRDGTPFPHWTPIGAGLLVRRAALVPGYLRHVEANAAAIARLSWRGQGAGGVEDKDLVLYTLRAGWSTAYVPGMMLTHIIPASRLQLSYFEKLLPAVQQMWAQTLHAHGFENRPPIHPATLWPRKIKAWFAFRAWRSPSHKLNWLASCGFLQGLARNSVLRIRYTDVNRQSGRT